MIEPSIPLSQVRAHISDAVKLAGEHCDKQLALIRTAIEDVKAHMDRRLEREVAPIRRDTEVLKNEVLGSGDAQPGLLRKLDAEKAALRELDRRVGEVEGEVRVTMNDLHGGRRIADKSVSSERPEKSRSERPEKSSDVQISLRLPRWALYLIVAGIVGGTSAITTMLGILNEPPQSAVNVQAEGVATMKVQASEELEEARVATVGAAQSNERIDEREADLERRERALQAREIELAAEAPKVQEIKTDAE